LRQRRDPGHPITLEPVTAGLVPAIHVLDPAPLAHEVID